jgi:Flp pilus assembly pilin Flp
LKVYRVKIRERNPILSLVSKAQTANLTYPHNVVYTIYHPMLIYNQEVRNMKERLKNLIISEEGQGMTEYIIIVALIAIATIGVITIFGDNIRALFKASTNALAGQNERPETKVFRGNVHKTLQDFSTKSQ